MIKDMLIRSLIPLAIMSAISLAMRLQNFPVDQVKSTLVVGLIIAVVAGGSVIYEIQGWTLLRQSLVHFCLMAATILPCLLLSGWFKLNRSSDYLVVLVVFLGVGVAMWFIGYLLFGKLLSK